MQPGYIVQTRCDVSDLEALKHCFDAAVLRFGAVDIMINNAGMVWKLGMSIIRISNICQECSLGIPERGVFEHSSSSLDVQRNIAVNLVAVVEGTRLAVQHMLKTGRDGVVLNVASMGGLVWMGHGDGWC